jgi:hypothetical protein
LSSYVTNGIDQIYLGLQYKVLGAALLVLAGGCFLLDAVRRGRNAGCWIDVRIPLELFMLSIFVRILLPEWISLPQYAAPASYLVSRFTSVCAVLALCVMACLLPQKWHLFLSAAAAVVYFVLLYQDTGRVAQMEEQVEHLLRTLPRGQRVTATIRSLPGSRLYSIHHIVDRACIGWCFSYSNYEPSSGQFRIRVQPGSPIVSASAAESDQIQVGHYVVQSKDLPLFQIYQCRGNLTNLCMRELRAGETNGAVGLQPVR